MVPRISIVVGIDTYPDAPLTCCAEDARQMSGMLEMPEFGFKSVLLTDDEATRSAVLKAIREAAAQKPERLLFYFSGHGAMTDIGGFLVTVDGDESEPGLDLAQLRRLLEKTELDETETIVVLDCCHAGSVQLPGASPLTRLELQRIVPTLKSSRVAIAACRPEQFSYESDSGLSLFTSHVIDGLFGGAADQDGNITISSLWDVVSKPFEAETSQEPVFKGNLLGRFVLGTGFSPCSLSENSPQPVSFLANKAETLVDEFGLARSSGSLGEFRRQGFLRECQVLEPILDWFLKTSRRHPSLKDEPKFRSAMGSVRAAQKRLGTLEADLRVRRGVVERQIGFGSFGAVWCVRDNDSAFAYKVYHPQEIDELEKVGRFKRGYQAMRQLDHPRIVKVHEYTECPLGFFMDYVDGPNLRSLGVGKSIPERSAILDLAISVAETVQHAHNRKVYHRDIKPENIVAMYDDKRGVWVPHLTDFDLAWFSAATQLTKEAFGAVYYAAPEQIERPRSKAAQDPRVDIYSFGQLLFFLVTSQDPAAADPAVRLELLRRSLGAWPSQRCATVLSDVYERCTRRDQEERFSMFRMVIDRLLEASQSLRHIEKESLGTDELVGESRFLLKGFSEEEVEVPCSFLSRSGSTRITLAVRASHPERVDLEVELTPNRVFALDGLSNERARASMNSRIATALQGYDNVRRRSGSHGVFQVFLDITSIPRRLPGPRRVAEIVTRAVDALERP